MNVAQNLVDALLRHGVDIEGLTELEVRRILVILREELEPEIQRQVEKALALTRISGLGVSIESTARLVRLQNQISITIANAIGSASAELRTALQAFATNEATWLQKAFTNVYPFQIDWVKPNARTLLNLVDDQVMAGSVLKTWWSTVEEAAKARIIKTINVGLAAGQSTQEVVRNLAGTTNQPGVLAITRRDAEKVVRTAMQTVTNATRTASYVENDDVLKGEQWSAFFDVNTCVTCANLDGTVYPVGEGRRPPEHPLCRCVMLPILRTFEEMGWNLSNPPELSKAAKMYTDAKQALVTTVPESMKYADWFKLQPAWLQRQWLGPARYELYKAGRIELKDLVNSQVRPLNMKQIMSRI